MLTEWKAAAGRPCPLVLRPPASLLNPIEEPWATAPGRKAPQSAGRGFRSHSGGWVQGSPILALRRPSPPLNPKKRLRRALAEEEVRDGAGGALAAAAGAAGEALYEPGTYERGGHKSLEAYLTRRAGMFVDVAEQLVCGHVRGL